MVQKQSTARKSPGSSSFFGGLDALALDVELRPDALDALDALALDALDVLDALGIAGRSRCASVPGPCGAIFPIMTPPNYGRLGACAELGRALELSVRSAADPRQILRFEWSGKKRPLLFWSPTFSALLIVLGAQQVTGPVGRHKAAAAARTRWTGKPPDAALVMELPNLPGRWRPVGTALRTDYASDKWNNRGSFTEFTHDHGPNVLVWERGDPVAGPGVLALRGGTLRVTARGIEG